MTRTRSSNGFTLPPWLEIGLRIALGGVFIYASIHKIIHPADFAVSIANYHLVPYAILHPLALLLPWLEVVCGLALVLGILRRGAAWLIVLMLMVFIPAIGSAVLRGLDISCGCFNTESGHTVGITLILQDLGLLITALIIIFNKRNNH